MPLSFSASQFAPDSLANRRFGPLTVALVTSLWLATFSNAALWQELLKLRALGGVSGLAFGLGFGVFVAASTFALLCLFAWRPVVKWACAALLIAAAFGAHFMLSYGIVIDSTMIVNVLKTDPGEVRDLLNVRLLLTLALLAALPVAVVMRMKLTAKKRPQRSVKAGLKTLIRNTLAMAAGLVVALTAVWLVFQDFSSLMRNHTHVRYLINPLNSVYALGLIAAGPTQRSSVRLPLGEDAVLAPAALARPALLVLVVGETARSDHFSLNGYSRLTNPKLTALGSEVVSFAQVRSCGTNTAASVPCMFSHLGRERFADRKTNFDNLLDVLTRAGLAVLWLDNQSGCHGVCDRVPNINTREQFGDGQQFPDLCKGGECFDEVMLRALPQELAKLSPERMAKGVVVVFHQMGSHGPAYFKRAPEAFKPFKPECLTNNLQACSKAELVNSYDNTLVYTDHLLFETRKWLQSQQTRFAPALLYVSDHGESLGENNIYLHGLPYAIAPDAQKHVPLITWLSPGYETQSRITNGCLKTQQTKALTHDHLFHSVLGLLGVSTSAKKPEMDMFAACR